MDTIFASFNINVVGLLWHSVNFLVLLGALWLLFFRPITRVLDERQRRVRESLIQAEEVKQLAVTAEAQRAEIIAAAHAEARDIRARAERQADGLLVRARATLAERRSGS
jgi:F-type H+-transporting ATPase subunit b